MNHRFQADQVGEIVGHACITPGREHTDTFEVAAWWVKHAFVPGGSYPVRLRANRYGQGPVHSYSLVIEQAPTEVVAANLTSIFGGVGYGNDSAGREAVGRKDRRDLCIASARSLDELDTKDLSAFAFHAKAAFYEVYGYYGYEGQFLHAQFDILEQAMRCVRRNPDDELSIVKVCRDGTRTTEF
jgi:hypothetical protein